VLAGYHAVLAARVIRHDVLVRMAAVSSVPVVNLLSDHSHPTQALADVLTMRQTIGPLGRRAVAWLGDYGNVARSLAEASALLACTSAWAAPRVQARRRQLERVPPRAAAVLAFDRPEEAVVGADAVHTGVDVDGPGRPSGGSDSGVRGWTVTERSWRRRAVRLFFTACPCTGARR
jgi:ornithine carbamoyltransferase